MIKDGLREALVQPLHKNNGESAYMLCASRRIVKEKQHRISGSFESGFGFLSEQLVKMAFCELSNAMAPNFSQ